MAEKINERDERINKIKQLEQQGINPFPAKVNRTHTIGEIIEHFSDLDNSQSTVVIAGRIRTKRAHGNLSFCHLEDGTGKIQAAFSKNRVGADNYKIFAKLIDSGDFLEITGKCFITKSGESSIMADNFRLLTKAIKPLPDKWHGFKDEEERLRKRYLDILFNPEVRELIEKKSVFWNAVRGFMAAKGFLEVETPVLENTAGGADARPFTTHHNALDMDVYLRISMGELWQKRLMVAGFEKTFEIGRQFRNEGMSAEHMQDYTQMEFYWAYADYEKGMALVEELFRSIAKETFGTLKYKIRDFDIDLSRPWEKYDYVSLIKDKTGINVLDTDAAAIENKLKELKIDYERRGFNLTRAIDNLWKYCRKDIAGPGFLVNVPVSMEPLAKRSENEPGTVERFQVMIAGSELGKGYSELNDPLDQAGRFRDQQALREAGDEEAQMYDNEFVDALEYGMPPCCGFGMSERVFAFLANKTVRECQIFPLLRRKEH